MTGDYSFMIKKGDTHKLLRFHLRRENTDGTYSDVDLTGASASFYMRKREKRTNKIDGSSCTISAPTAGKGYYEFSSSDVDETGTFDAEIKVTFSDSTEETFPDDQQIIVIIYEDLE